MLGKTVFAMALGAATMLAGPAAQACVWTFGVPAVNAAAIGVTATTDAGLRHLLDIEPDCLRRGRHPTPTQPQLFSKNQGPGEIGIGLTHDLTLERTRSMSVTTSSSLSLAGVTGSHGHRQ